MPAAGAESRPPPSISVRRWSAGSSWPTGSSRARPSMRGSSAPEAWRLDFATAPHDDGGRRLLPRAQLALGGVVFLGPPAGLALALQGSREAALQHVERAIEGRDQRLGHVLHVDGGPPREMEGHGAALVHASLRAGKVGEGHAHRSRSQLELGENLSDPPREATAQERLGNDSLDIDGDEHRREFPGHDPSSVGPVVTASPESRFEQGRCRSATGLAPRGDSLSLSALLFLGRLALDLPAVIRALAEDLARAPDLLVRRLLDPQRAPDLVDDVLVRRGHAAADGLLA